MVDVLIALIVVGIVVVITTGVLALTYTVICMIGGVGAGVVLTLFVLRPMWERQQEREADRRAEEHQRVLDIIEAAQVMSPRSRQPREDLITIEHSKRDVPRIARRPSF